MDGREIDDVEAHAVDFQQSILGVLKGPVGVRVRAAGTGEVFIPGAEGGEMTFSQQEASLCARLQLRVEMERDQPAQVFAVCGVDAFALGELGIFEEIAIFFQPLFVVAFGATSGG